MMQYVVLQRPAQNAALLHEFPQGDAACDDDEIRTPPSLQTRRASSELPQSLCRTNGRILHRVGFGPQMMFAGCWTEILG